MKKNCEYCNQSFEASRRDTKYCSNSCKQSAYIARSFKDEAPVIEYNSQEEYRPNRSNSHHNTSRRGKNVNDSITLSRSEFNRILSTNSAQAPLNHLLTEKDFGRDILALNSELKMELKFTNKELDELKDKYKAIEQENEKLHDIIESTEETKSEKLMSLIMQHADTAMPAITGLASALVHKITGTSPQLSGTPKQEATKAPKPDPNNLEEEQIENINRCLSQIMEIYPDVPLVTILEKIVSLMTTNKTMADTILYAN